MDTVAQNLFLLAPWRLRIKSAERDKREQDGGNDMIKKLFQLYDKYNTAINIVLYALAISAWIFYVFSFIRVAYCLAAAFVTAEILFGASVMIASFKKDWR